MNSKVRTGRATRVLATAAMLSLLVASLMAGSVFAAKGGAGKPGGGGTTSSATIVPSCNPCAVGAVVHFTGSGYSQSLGTVQLNIAGAATSAGVSSSGTIAFDWPYFQAPGSFLVKAWQATKNSTTNNAQVTVVVQ